MEPDLSDEQLLAAFQQGDAGAFEHLLQRHRGPLFTFLLRMLADKERACDLAQKTFLRAIKGAGAWHQGERFKPSLYAIARNLCVDARRLDRGESSDAPVGGDESSAGPPPALLRAFASLPAEQREVFLLREQAGLQYGEIAAVLALAADTVQGRMEEALEELRRQLEETGSPHLHARTRRLLAPLVQVIEPPVRLDAKIAEAARAEAFLLSGGAPGKVIESSAREQAPAVEAVQIDARARVRKPVPRNPRRAWVLRAAVTGAIAAAAGLALLVATGPKKPVLIADPSNYRIEIRAPGAEPVRAPAAPVVTVTAPPPPPVAARPAVHEETVSPRAAIPSAAPALERRAESARRSGSYSSAASLYREAGSLRVDADEKSEASWDLAHEVECLAAAGNFASAQIAGSELMRRFPAAVAAQSAAARALRTAPPAADRASPAP